MTAKNYAILEDLIQENGKANGNLLGVDGNAFGIMGYTAGRLRMADWPKDDITKVMEIAQSGGYDNVIATCLTVLEEDDPDDY
jgi:hypothetical protein